MSKIYITADSTADLSPELLAKFDIKTVPLHIIYDDAEYLDGVDIGPDDIIVKYAESGKLPKTSAVSVGEYLDFFGALTADGSKVVHFSLSSGVSSTYGNACAAAAETEGVSVVDTLLLTSAMGFLILKACEMRDKGYSAEEIVRVTSEMRSKVRCTFILEKLDFMAKGGRCSSVAAFGANILGIKPAIGMTDGKLGVGKKYRGKIASCRLQYVTDQLDCDDFDRNTAFFTSSPGVSEEQKNDLLREIKKLGKFENVYVTTAGCTVTSHCGAGCIGVLVLKK